MGCMRSMGGMTPSVAVRRATLATFMVCAVSLKPDPARAADDAVEGERVHLSYTAPEGCPSEDEFLDTVARDGGHLARAPEGEVTRAFVVTVEVSHAVSGRLLVRETDGTEAARPIVGDRCEDVVRSLAVLVALSLRTSMVPGASAGISAGARVSAGVGADAGISASTRVSANTGAPGPPSSSETPSDSVQPTAPAPPMVGAAEAADSSEQPPDPDTSPPGPWHAGFAVGPFGRQRGLARTND
jgi:hypothetical protein